MISRKQVKAALSLLGWQQAKLAAKTGLSPTTISAILGGNTAPRTSNLDLIRKKLELSGIQFLSANGKYGEGVRLRRSFPELKKRVLFEGSSVIATVIYNGLNIRAQITEETLEDLGELFNPTSAELVNAFDNYEHEILAAIAMIYDEGLSDSPSITVPYNLIRPSW